MEINIKTKPILEMRWNGLGDYYPTKDGVKNIYIAETGNELYNRFIAIHELIEDTLLMAHGIPVEVIDSYCDKVFASGKELTSDNPDSPIHREHLFSGLLEYLTVLECGIERKKYDEDIEELFRINNLP
jgi:hypothetical protein